jgi:hypothetical protein
MKFDKKKSIKSRCLVQFFLNHTEYFVSLSYFSVSF